MTVADSPTRPDYAEWVTLREAAAETGASIAALRRWYREGLVRSVVVPGAHGDQRLVEMADVVARAAASPNLGKRRRAADDTDTAAVVDALVDQVAALAAEVAGLRARLDSLESAG